jgi:hypothetical protein
MPPTLIRTLVYEDNRVLNAGAGSISAFAVKANGLYDPNSSGIGHQPNGYDQMGIFYNRYVVMKSKLKITAYPTATDTTFSIIGSCLLPTTTLATDLQELLEQAVTVYKPFKNHSLYGQAETVVQTCDVGKHYGISNVAANPDLTATFTSDPSRLLTYNIFTTAADFTADAGSFLVRIRVEYEVLFSDRINVPES